jgi:hypothetical protein
MEELPGDPAVISRRGLTIRLAALAGAALLGTGGAGSVAARRKRSRSPWGPADGQFGAAGAGDDSSGSDAEGDSNTGTGGTGTGGSNAGNNVTGDDAVGDDAVGDDHVGDSAHGENADAGADATGDAGAGDDAVSVVVGSRWGWRWSRP